MKKFENEVVFVQLTKRTVVHEIKTKARYENPEWKLTENVNLKKAEILNIAGIKFATSSDLGRFTIMVSQKDAEIALELFKEK